MSIDDSVDYAENITRHTDAPQNTPKEKQKELTIQERAYFVCLSHKINPYSDNQIIKLGERYFKVRELG